MLPSGRDLSRAHDHVEFEVRESERLRIDLYLLRRLGWKSRAKVQKLIDVGRVLINGQKPRPSSRTLKGDRVHITLDGGGESLDEGGEPLPAPLWEDAHLIAVDKPPGRLVHPVGRTVSGTVVNELHHRFRGPNKRGCRPVTPKLCHRLDRDTSGVLLAAKHDLARTRLSDAFEVGTVRKTYLAIVEGEPIDDHFSMTVAIAANLDRQRKTDNRLAVADPDGKWAHTDFEVLNRHGSHSLVCCRPLTGRQNQIRIHLAHHGTPILGDVGYGSATDRWLSLRPDLPFPNRALLHSSSLEFPHPVWSILHRIDAPLPEDFRNLLQSPAGPGPSSG